MFALCLIRAVMSSSFGEITLLTSHVWLRHGMTQTVFQLTVSVLKALLSLIVRGPDCVTACQ